MVIGTSGNFRPYTLDLGSDVANPQFGSINRQYLTKISASRIVLKYKKLMHVFMICILIRHVKSPLDVG